MANLHSSRRRVIHLSIAVGSVALLSHTPVFAEAEPQLRQVEVPGGALPYQLMGSGPTIVLLAGGPGASSDYLLPLAGMLAAVALAIIWSGDSRPCGLLAAEEYHMLSCLDSQL